MNTDAALKSYRMKKVMTIEELTLRLKCSTITARRFLKRTESFTSINKNAKYYTLPTIPRFDSNGLWNYKGIFFSQRGNLTQTVVYLIQHSAAGLSADEIEKMVGLADNSSFVSTFKHLNAVKREVIGGKGTGRYIYFAQSQAVYLRQHTQRHAFSVSLPSDCDAITILVELIKHPEASSIELEQILCAQGKRINQHSIKQLLVHHSLKKNPEN